MARDQLDLAARFTERLWDSPLGDFLHELPPDMAVQIATDLVVGLLIEVSE
jgi:hypothetical protein